MPRYDPRDPAPPRKPAAPYNPYPNGRYRDYEPGAGTTYYPGGTGAAPPPAAPGPVAPPAPPAPIDWAALISGDPEYIAKLAALTRQRHDAVVNFGDGSDIAGVDAQTAAEAANNPYSVTSMLRQQLASNQRNLTNQANAHGVLFSGAATQNRSNEANQGVQRQFSATQQLLSMLGGYGDQQQQAYADAYNRLASNPPVSPVNDPAASPPAAAAVPPPATAAPAAHGFTGSATAPWAKPPTHPLPTIKLSSQPAVRNKVKLPKGPLPARYG